MKVEDIDEKVRARFEAKVARNANANGCDLWTGGAGMYGIFRLRDKTIMAHRVAVLIDGREIPEGMVVRHGHGCSTLCVNPAHLTVGTLSENQADRLRDGTSHRGEANHTSKLTEKQVLEICARSLSGAEVQNDIAADFGICRETVSIIKHGKKWGWLTWALRVSHGVTTFC